MLFLPARDFASVEVSRFVAPLSMVCDRLVAYVSNTGIAAGHQRITVHLNGERTQTSHGTWPPRWPATPTGLLRMTLDSEEVSSVSPISLPHVYEVLRIWRKQNTSKTVRYLLAAAAATAQPLTVFTAFIATKQGVFIPEQTQRNEVTTASRVEFPSTDAVCLPQPSSQQPANASRWSSGDDNQKPTGQSPHHSTGGVNGPPPHSQPSAVDSHGNEQNFPPAALGSSRALKIDSVGSPGPGYAQVAPQPFGAFHRSHERGNAVASDPRAQYPASGYTSPGFEAGLPAAGQKLVLRPLARIAATDRPPEGGIALPTSTLPAIVSDNAHIGNHWNPVFRASISPEPHGLTKGTRAEEVPGVDRLRVPGRQLPQAPLSMAQNERRLPELRDTVATSQPVLRGLRPPVPSTTLGLPREQSPVTSSDQEVLNPQCDCPVPNGTRECCTGAASSQAASSSIPLAAQNPASTRNGGVSELAGSHVRGAVRTVAPEASDVQAEHGTLAHGAANLGTASRAGVNSVSFEVRPSAPVAIPPELAATAPRSSTGERALCYDDFRPAPGPSSSLRIEAGVGASRPCEPVARAPQGCESRSPAPGHPNGWRVPNPSAGDGQRAGAVDTSIGLPQEHTPRIEEVAEERNREWKPSQSRQLFPDGHASVHIDAGLYQVREGRTSQRDLSAKILEPEPKRHRKIQYGYAEPGVATDAARWTDVGSSKRGTPSANGPPELPQNRARPGAVSLAPISEILIGKDSVDGDRSLPQTDAPTKRPDAVPGVEADAREALSHPIVMTAMVPRGPANPPPPFSLEKGGSHVEHTDGGVQPVAQGQNAEHDVPRATYVPGAEYGAPSSANARSTEGEVQGRWGASGGRLPAYAQCDLAVQESAIVPTTVPGVLYPCGMCAAHFQQREDLIRHQHTVHAAHGLNGCRCCNANGTDAGTSRGHRRGPQVEAQSWVCEECGQGFGRKSSLSRHRATVHEKQRFSCRFCSKSYSQKHDAVKHERKVHGSDQ